MVIDDGFTAYKFVVASGAGRQKSSVRSPGNSGDLRIVPAEKRRAAMQYFPVRSLTICASDRAIALGSSGMIGLFRIEDGNSSRSTKRKSTMPRPREIPRVARRAGGIETAERRAPRSVDLAEPRDINSHDGNRCRDDTNVAFAARERASQLRSDPSRRSRGEVLTNSARCTTSASGKSAPDSRRTSSRDR